MSFFPLSFFYDWVKKGLTFYWTKEKLSYYWRNSFSISQGIMLENSCSQMSEKNHKELIFTGYGADVAKVQNRIWKEEELGHLFVIILFFLVPGLTLAQYSLLLTFGFNLKLSHRIKGFSATIKIKVLVVKANQFIRYHTLEVNATNIPSLQLSSLK